MQVRHPRKTSGHSRALDGAIAGKFSRLTSPPLSGAVLAVKS